MRIGGFDVAVSQDNMKRFHRNTTKKRARVKVAPIENIDNLITSSENESSSQSQANLNNQAKQRKNVLGHLTL